MVRPDSTEFAEYYGKYVALVPEDDIVATLESQMTDARSLFHTISESQANTVHAPYRWSVKEVVGHLTDCERIFGYRALRFARGDVTPLPGFDENEYVRVANFDRLAFTVVVAEFEAVRHSTVALFKSLNEAAWTRRGEANSNVVSVRAVPYIVVGHTRHHLAIVRQRLAKA